MLGATSERDFHQPLLITESFQISNWMVCWWHSDNRVGRSAVGLQQRNIEYEPQTRLKKEERRGFRVAAGNAFPTSAPTD